ncbi:uncharacterized protein LOC143634249 [Bidens hawaiensis]|uniref:uncharacterized protein LOC143634249 n=1 Tax=Bidens hawaiensis TaxID=980011 RepID=UPI0040495275
MPSVQHFRQADQQIRALVLQSGDPLLAQRVTNLLQTMSVSFERLIQTRARRGARYPREADEVLDYLGYTPQQIQDEHAQVSEAVFSQRLVTTLLTAVFGNWPHPGDDNTMPVVVYYTTGFHALMYISRGIDFQQLRVDVSLVCNINVGQFTMRYSNGYNYILLADENEWAACNTFYDNSAMARLHLLVTAG